MRMSTRVKQAESFSSMALLSIEQEFGRRFMQINADGEISVHPRESAAIVLGFSKKSNIQKNLKLLQKTVEICIFIFLD